MNDQFPRRLNGLLAAAKAVGVTVAAFIAGCASSPMPPSQAPSTRVPPPSASGSVPSYGPPAPSASPQSGAQTPPVHFATASVAATPKAYRRDAASHLYARNETRIYKGKLPPLLYAIGVLEVEVDGQGKVRSTNWLRAPKHAPEVIAEIERTVRQAQPYPAPTRLGKVTYTDTWLWDASGKFQLDTLTEGQL